LKNTLYEFGALIHCFNDRSLNEHNCQSSKCALARTQARRRALHQLCYQLHSVKRRAKYSTVLQLRELVTGTRTVGQGSK